MIGRMSLAGRRVLVTGAAGFLGGQVSEALRREGAALCGLDRLAPRSASPFDAFVVADLAAGAADAVSRFRPDLVFHLAGGVSAPGSTSEPLADFEATVPGTAALLQAMVRTPAPADLVYFSSAAVYGAAGSRPLREDDPAKPLSPYGAHKAACEAMISAYAGIYGFRASILRIFSAYGEGLTRQFFWEFGSRALAAAARGDEAVTVLGREDDARDFIDAEDVAGAACLVARRRGGGVEAYNVATGRETKIGWAAQALLGHLGLDLRLSFTGAANPGAPDRLVADVSRLSALGHRPARALESRLPDLARWIASRC